MRMVIARLGRRLRMTHPDDDLSPSQFEVLATVARRGTLRLAELADIEGLNPTMLSRIATRLEDKGLVVRTQDAGDRRVASLEATPGGIDLYQQILCERTEALVQALGQLPEEDRRKLLEALGVLESLAEALKRQ
jgi:DNA-binding MarR family transcriptional regulator